MYQGNKPPQKTTRQKGGQMKDKFYDNSMLSQYQKCPMSYYLQYVKQLKKKYIDDSNAAMNFGDYFHKFAENRLIPRDFTFDTYVAPEDLPQYSKDSLQMFCNAYADKYASDGKDFEVLECENVFDFKLGDKDFKVKCDAVIAFRGNIFGLELKTTKSISYNYFNKYFLNSQITAQTYAITKKYGQCSGVLLRVGEIKSLKRKPTGEYDATRLVDDLYVACKFNSDYVNRTKQEISDWETNTESWINQIKFSHDTNFFPKSTGSWGGAICSACEYRDLCKVSQGLNLDEEITDLLYSEVDSLAYLANNPTREE